MQRQPGGSVDAERLRLFLMAAHDEPALRSPDYHRELRDFAESLKAHGIDFSAQAELLEAVGAETVYPGDFGIRLAAIIGPALGTVLGAWLHAKYGREVRAKIGEIAVEA
jgi:hypothetical protein